MAGSGEAGGRLCEGLVDLVAQRLTLDCLRSWLRSILGRVGMVAVYEAEYLVSYPVIWSVLLLLLLLLLRLQLLLLLLVERSGWIWRVGL